MADNPADQDIVPPVMTTPQFLMETNQNVEGAISLLDSIEERVDELAKIQVDVTKLGAAMKGRAETSVVHMKEEENEPLNSMQGDGLEKLHEGINLLEVDPRQGNQASQTPERTHSDQKQFFSSIQVPNPHIPSTAQQLSSDDKRARDEPAQDGEEDHNARTPRTNASQNTPTTRAPSLSPKYDRLRQTNWIRAVLRLELLRGTVVSRNLDHDPEEHLLTLIEAMGAKREYKDNMRAFLREAPPLSKWLCVYDIAHDGYEKTRNLQSDGFCDSCHDRGLDPCVRVKRQKRGELCIAFTNLQLRD